MAATLRYPAGRSMIITTHNSSLLMKKRAALHNRSQQVVRTSKRQPALEVGEDGDDGSSSRRIFVGTAAVAAGVGLALASGVVRLPSKSPAVRVRPAAVVGTNDVDNQLAEGWYDVVANKLGVSNNRVSLYQTPVTLGTTAVSVAQALNTLPSVSGREGGVTGNDTWTNVYGGTPTGDGLDPGTGGLLFDLQPKDPDSVAYFRAVLGDYFQDWQDYLKSQRGSGKTTQQVFLEWLEYSPVTDKSAAKVAFNRTNNDAVAQAGYAFNNPKNYINNDLTAPKFIGSAVQTYEGFKAQVQAGAPITINFDSSTDKKRVNTLAGSIQVGTAFGLFTKESSSSSLVSRLRSSRIVISAKYDHMTVVPYTAGPWYNNTLIENYALVDPDHAFKQPRYYDSYFGKNGNFRWVPTGVIATTGLYDITTTVYSSFTDEDQQLLLTAAKAGYWPFINMSAAYKADNLIINKDSNTVTVSTKGNQPGVGVLGNVVSVFPGIQLGGQ